MRWLELYRLPWVAPCILVKVLWNEVEENQKEKETENGVKTGAKWNRQRRRAYDKNKSVSVQAQQGQGANYFSLNLSPCR